VNPFVVDPEWGWWIILYFFLGGIAAGAYFVAALIELIGTEADRVVARTGYRVAFPLILVCGLLLTIDLERPERFWHMLLQSQVVDQALADGWPRTGAGWLLMLQSPMLKPWSPMSIGAWALFVFGLFSFVSFLSSLWPGRWLDNLLHRRWLGHAFQLAGSGVGFFVAAYTGSLLTATNQPLWSQTDWIAPLFLTSAATAGIAVFMLAGPRTVTDQVRQRLERADLLALGLEACVFVLFLVSLRTMLPEVWQVWQGKVLLVAVPVLGLILPLALHRLRERVGGWRVYAAMGSVLLGGFLLRYAVVITPPALLARGTVTPAAEIGTPAALLRISPEDGRPRGGGPGASALNRGDILLERSKIPQTKTP
jgi:formate-dependent nitrite reductase membrane component NrfD